MLELIQKINIKYKIWKFEKSRRFGEAMIILKHAIKTKSFPHGDSEYAKILGQEV